MPSCKQQHTTSIFFRNLCVYFINIKKKSLFKSCHCVFLKFYKHEIGIIQRKIWSLLILLYVNNFFLQFIIQQTRMLSTCAITTSTWILPQKCVMHSYVDILMMMEGNPNVLCSLICETPLSSFFLSIPFT